MLIFLYEIECKLPMDISLHIFPKSAKDNLSENYCL